MGEGLALMGNYAIADYVSIITVPATPNTARCEMSIPCKSEGSVLSHEELEMVRATHHPAIYSLDGKGLHALQSRLREQRSKTRTLARQKQREMRGKADQRGRSFPGTAEQPLRKQVFANALKRVNKEIDRLRKFEARTAHVEAARRAWMLSRSEKFRQYPAAGQTPREGMQPKISVRRRTTVARSKIGSVMKATSIAQAIRDARR